MVQGVKELHDRGWAHMDLKLENAVEVTVRDSAQIELPYALTPNQPTLTIAAVAVRGNAAPQAGAPTMSNFGPCSPGPVKYECRQI